QAGAADALAPTAGQAVWGTAGASGGEGARHFFGGGGWAVTPAQATSLSAPELEVVKDETTGDRRTLTLRLTPSGTTPVVGLRLEPPGPAAGPPVPPAGPITVDRKSVV